MFTADSSVGLSSGAMPVKTFSYGETPVRLCVDSAKQIWISSNDVAKAIGITNPRNFCRLLDEIDKLTQKMPTGRGDQDTVLISLWGYQQLATKTRNKGLARAFSHWLLGAIGNCLASNSSQAAQNRSMGHFWYSTETGGGNAPGTSPFHCKEPWDGVLTPDPARSFRPEPGSSWEKAALNLKETLGDAIFRSWITKLTFDFIKDDTVVLRTANSFLRDTIMERYTYALLKAWQSIESRIEIPS